MILENSVADTLLVGTSEADSILNLADDVTINSGDGDDTVYSGLEGQAANRALINLGSGNNQATIQGGSDKVSVIAGDGNNVIQTTSPNNLLQSGSGNDSLCCYTGSDNNTMISGDGDDVIDAVGHNVTINAGSGNDTIQTYRNAYDISINAGTGDDVITLRGPVDTDHTNLVQYAEGDGNDTITNFSETDSLQITSGTISNAKLVGNNVVVTVGSGTITLIEANNMNINLVDAEGNLTQTIFSGGTLPPEVPGNTLIAGTSGDDYLSNAGGKNVTINGLGGNDTIVNALVDKKVNTGNYSVINAGEGDNKVSIAGSAYVTVNTGDGSNTICSDSNGMDNVIYLGNGKNSVITSNRRSSIIGGAGGNGITLHNGSFNSYVEAGDGNDTVAVGHYEITVKGGDGDDVINLFRDAEDSFIIPGKGNDKITVYNNKHSQTYQYTQGDGDDTVTGFGADDTLKVVGVSSVSSVVKDGNLVLDFGDGSFTFAGVSAAASLNVEYIAKWSTLEGGAYKFTSPAQNYFPTSTAQKFADFTLSGGNLKDGDGDEIPDGVSIGAVRYVPQSGVHTNINHLSGNVVYNGDSLGVEGDEDYAIEAISPIDLSEKFPNDVYIIDPNVTAIRGVSDKATVSPRGTAGTSTAADWISIDSTDSKVTFLDGTYCVYTENKFSTRDYTKLSISNNNAGVEISASEDLIKTIGNLQDGYEITIESGINVGEKIDFKTSGAGVIVVKTTANSGKYSLDADSDEWQYQHFTLGSDDEFTFVFGENGSVVGVEGFDANLQTDDNSLFKAEWVTLSGGGFEYTGNAKNNPSKWVTFTVSGASITSTDNLTVTNNMYIPSMGGNRIAINGLNGNAFIDDNELGIGGDSNYAAHFTKSADDINNSNIVVLNISDGATVHN
ncbi:MAG: calcium-binding protein, partial [Selenomonadaceae bacterium]|nr:calcium-binding protein [Selenomonadaceae bacterium]